MGIPVFETKRTPPPKEVPNVENPQNEGVSLFVGISMTFVGAPLDGFYLDPLRLGSENLWAELSFAVATCPFC